MTQEIAADRVGVGTIGRWGLHHEEKAMFIYAEMWVDHLIDQKFEVEGGVKLAAEYAEKTLGARSENPESRPVISAKLKKRMSELEGVNDPRAQKLALILGRVAEAFSEAVPSATNAKTEASAEVAASADHAFAQGHVPPPAFVVVPGPTGQAPPNGWLSRND